MMTINKNISIASVSFSIEESAYELLNRYFKSLDSYYKDHSLVNALGEVEERIAEMFSDQQGNNQPITYAQVRQAIEDIGHPAGVFNCETPPQPKCQPKKEKSNKFSKEFLAIILSIVTITIKIIASTLAVIIGLLIVGVFITMGVMLTTGSGLTDFYIINQPTLTVIATTLAVAAPLGVIFYLICKLIFGYRWSKFTIISLSVLTLGACIYCSVIGTKEVTARVAKSSVENSTNYDLTSGKLTIKIEPKKVVEGDLSILTEQYNSRNRINVIEDSELSDSIIRVEIVRTARAETTLQAQEEASKIEYQYNYSTNTLTLPLFMQIETQGNKFYNQKLTINIYTPVGLAVAVPEGEHRLVNFDSMRRGR